VTAKHLLVVNLGYKTDITQWWLKSRPYKRSNALYN